MPKYRSVGSNGFDAVSAAIRIDAPAFAANVRTMLTPDKAARMSRHRNQDSPKSQLRLYLYFNGSLGQGRSHEQDFISIQNLAMARKRPPDVSMSTMTAFPSPLDDWPASRHVTGTGLMCYPFRSSKPQQAWSAPRSSMCAEARSLQ